MKHRFPWETTCILPTTRERHRLQREKGWKRFLVILGWIIYFVMSMLIFAVVAFIALTAVP